MKPSTRRRLAFGIGELREKLVAEDAAIDDRHVELAKVMALHEHPVLLRRPRLRLFLDRVGPDRLHFFAGYDHAQQTFKVDVPRFAFDRLSHGVAQKWTRTAHKIDLFRAPDALWVSVRRWVPGNTALNTLHQSADIVRRGERLDLDSPAFKLMVANLPRGSQLPTTAKEKQQKNKKKARTDGRSDIQDELFEVRFGVELDDEWGKDRATGDIDTLWDLLKTLPDTNVEGNAHIHEIFLKPGEGGGSFDPTSDDVEVTNDPEAASFQTVMRHEIGHAVHEKLDKEQKQLVTNYLTLKFGWEVYPGDTAGARAWVDAMDGWGQIAEGDRRNIADALVASLGNGSSWAPPPVVSLPSSSPWWNGDFGPRLAVTGTLENWYDSNSKWYRKGSKAYFLNYWYRQFMIVDISVLDFINTRMPWDYAAMSPAEFFAELYALYYNLGDPRRAAIPPDVAAWLSQNVGVPRATAPVPPSTT